MCFHFHFNFCFIFSELDVYAADVRYSNVSVDVLCNSNLSSLQVWSANENAQCTFCTKEENLQKILTLATVLYRYYIHTSFIGLEE